MFDCTSLLGIPQGTLPDAFKVGAPAATSTYRGQSSIVHFINQGVGDDFYTQFPKTNSSIEVTIDNSKPTVILVKRPGILFISSSQGSQSGSVLSIYLYRKETDSVLLAYQGSSGTDADTWTKTITAIGIIQVQPGDEVFMSQPGSGFGDDRSTATGIFIPLG
jgi:hypothetical protein